MATFVYKALKVQGGVDDGELDAMDRPDAFRKLDRKGLQPVSLELKSNDLGAVEKKQKSRARGENAEGEEELEKGPVKLTRSQVVLFTEELSDMLAAGLQLEPALKVMEKREELSGVKTVTRNLRQMVRDGNSFSKSLAASSPSFGPLYCSLAAAGEVSGALPTILKRQAEYLVTLQDLQTKVLFALIYPAFLIVSGIAVSILFMTVLIPQLTELIEKTDGNMPLGARMIMSFSDFLKSYWWGILILVIFGIIFAKSWLRTPANRLKWDEMKLKIPFVGSVLSSRFFVQFLETLSNLVGNGLPILRGLELSEAATQNLYLKKLVGDVKENVGDGASLTRTMKRVGFFPSLLIDMVSVGEETGDQGGALARAAQRYDKELAKRIEKMTALVQPLIIVVMALIVGVMAYLMITAIFQTISGMNAR